MLALGVVRPINHFSGFHTFYPTFASGEGAAPFKTVADYENNLKRHRDYVVFNDRAIGRFRAGHRRPGVFETEAHHPQRDRAARPAARPRRSRIRPSTARSARFPADFSEADKTRLTRRLPGVDREGDLPGPPPAPRFPARRISAQGPRRRRPRPHEGRRQGLSAPDREHDDPPADRRARSTTPGCARSPGSRPEMEIGQDPHGLQGHARRSSSNICAPTPSSGPRASDALRDGYYAIARKVDARIARAILDHSEEPARNPAGRAIPREDRSRRLLPAGHARRLAPRHLLLQRLRPALAPDLGHGDALPPRRQRRAIISRSASPRRMRRFPPSCASAATPPMSRAGRSMPRPCGTSSALETDPYQRFGGLNDEMLRAMRLVVDTGIHAKGWSRDQAIDYMLANSGMSRTEVVAEVERYIAIPGQALAYKIGALTIQRLRAKAADGARRPLRPARLPRPGADDRIAADGGAREEDRRLDRCDEGLDRRLSVILAMSGGSESVSARSPLARRIDDRRTHGRSRNASRSLIGRLLAGSARGLHVLGSRPRPPLSPGAARPPRRPSPRSSAKATRLPSAAIRSRPLARGDLRYADRLGDFFSDAYYKARARVGPGASFWRSRQIDRAALDRRRAGRLRRLQVAAEHGPARAGARDARR